MASAQLHVEATSARFPNGVLCIRAGIALEMAAQQFAQMQQSSPPAAPALRYPQAASFMQPSAPPNAKMGPSPTPQHQQQMSQLQQPQDMYYANPYMSVGMGMGSGMPVAALGMGVLPNMGLGYYPNLYSAQTQPATQPTAEYKPPNTQAFFSGFVQPPSLAADQKVLAAAAPTAAATPSQAAFFPGLVQSADTKGAGFFPGFGLAQQQASLFHVPFGFGGFNPMVDAQQRAASNADVARLTNNNAARGLQVQRLHYSFLL